MVLAKPIDGLVEPFYTRWVRVENCLCPDGKRRTAHITGEADTYFSIPAYVKVRGVQVTGYVTGVETEDGERDLEFRVVTNRKNAWVFPQQVLLTGATIEHVDRETGVVYSRGTISHWYWDNRPYWQGKPRWLVVVSYTYHNPEVYGAAPAFVGADGYWSQVDAESVMRGIYRGDYRVSGGREIGPRTWEGGTYRD